MFTFLLPFAGKHYHILCVLDSEFRVISHTYSGLSLPIEHVTIIDEEDIVLCWRLPSHPEERT